MKRNLIYDIGMHKGQDTEFYLKKGFVVVAIDANPELCAEVAARFPGEIDAGRLVIVNKAIAEQAGEVTFYRNEKLSCWGTIHPAWAKRNEAHYAPSTEITVEATTMPAVLEQFGVPYYVKIDIEGSDMTALRGLANDDDRPKYVSIEAEKSSFRTLHMEFDALQDLGYTRFKIVPQHAVHRQMPPKPSKEGQYVSHVFEGGSSGLFGEEAPGPWLTAAEAINAYRPIFLRHALLGDDPLIRSRCVRRGLRALIGSPGWYDTHAKLG